jgi:hypothetical protein
MTAQALTRIYSELIEVGLVRNKRDFSRWLGRGRSYLRTVQQRDCRHLNARVTTELRSRLAAVASTAPSAIGNELRRVIRHIDHANRVGAWLRG